MLVSETHAGAMMIWVAYIVTQDHGVLQDLPAIMGHVWVSMTQQQPESVLMSTTPVAMGVGCGEQMPRVWVAT